MNKMTEETSKTIETEVDEGLSVDEIDFTEEKYHVDIYFPEDFPDMKFPEDLRADKLPDFIKEVLGAGYVSDFYKVVFMRKFGFLYLESDFIREHTDDWHFLFYKQKYLGAFRYVKDLDNYGYSQGYGFFHIPMYPRIIGSEGLETFIPPDEK